MDTGQSSAALGVTRADGEGWTVEKALIVFSAVVLVACVVLAVVCIVNGWWLILSSVVISGAANALNIKTARTNMNTARVLAQMRGAR